MSAHRSPDASRPDFEPPAPVVGDGGVDASATAGSQPGSLATARLGPRWIRSLVTVGVAVIAVVAVVAALGALGHRRAGDSLTNPHARSTPRPLTHPLPTSGPRPAEPMLGQVWKRGDDVYPMDLSGLTFSFRAPGTWGCLRSSQAGVRWVCMDETGVVGGSRTLDPSGGIIESDECAAPCAAAGYADVLRRLTALGIDSSGLHAVDARTRVDDRPDPAHPDGRLYRMSRVYDSDSDGTLDRHLWVRISASSADEIAVEKMLGDLYDATR